MIVRPATVDDAEALAMAHVRTWREAYRGQIPQHYLDQLDPAQRQPVWRRSIQQPHTRGGTFVLEEDGEVAGFITVSPSRDPDTDPQRVGEVRSVYVVPEHWGNGRGQLLLEKGLRRLHDAGYRKVVLSVLETNDRARRFYEAGGWRADGSVKVDDSRGFPLSEVRYRYRSGGAR